MIWFRNLLARLTPDRITITLNLDEREGGYVFISSPQLKGFSLLIAPGDYKDFKALLDAVYDPLMTYMNVYNKAHKSARDHQKKLRLYSTSTSVGDGLPIVAKMCFQ